MVGSEGMLCAETPLEETTAVAFRYFDFGEAGLLKQLGQFLDGLGIDFHEVLFANSFWGPSKTDPIAYRV